MSVKDMAQLSQIPYGGTSFEITKNLSQQKSYSAVGFFLLLMSFLFALLNLLLPMRWSDFSINITGLIFAIVASIIIFFIAYKVSKHLQKKWFNQAKNVLEGEKK